MSIKFESKVVVASLVFEYLLFQPLWNKYVIGKINYDDFNILGFLCLMCITSLIVLGVLSNLKVSTLERPKLNKVTYIVLGALFILSFISFQVDKFNSIKVVPYGVEGHETHFKGFWQKDKFGKDFELCTSQNLNFYECFEGLEESPWVFPSFWEYVLFVLVAAILALVFCVCYCFYLFSKV